MQSPVNTFVGRKAELKRWAALLDTQHSTGQAVVVVGKYGMGKTQLLDQMLLQAAEHPSLQCVSMRYVLAPGESPGMVLRMILDDMFQGARYEAGSLDPDGKRFVQWTQFYRRYGFFTPQHDPHLHLLDRLRFDNLKNSFEQFVNRLQLFAELLPDDGRLLFVIDPALDTPASRFHLWAQVVQKLPPKVFFLFAQRYKDTLATDKEFQSLENVHFIPPLDTQGISDLSDSETQELTDAYEPVLKNKIADRQVLQEVFHRYRNHPYAVHAALNMLMTDSFTKADELPPEPMPQSVCPLQWKAVTEHPLAADAVPLLSSYAVLDVPALDEMVCWVADISQEMFSRLLADPYIRSLIRDGSDGRQIYHHYFSSYLHTLLYTPDGKLTELAENQYRRALTGYYDLMDRSVKPDPQVTVRLAETALIVGGPVLFAATLCQTADAFMRLGFYQTYASLIDRALTLIQPNTIEASDLYFQLGQLRHRQRDYKSAVKYYNAALNTARELSETTRVGKVLIGLAKAAWEQVLYDESERFLQEAKNKYESINDLQGLTEVLLLAGQLLSDQGRYQEAEHVLNKALQSTAGMKNHRQQARNMAEIYAAWGRMYDAMGQIERATREYHKAIDLTKDSYDRRTEAELRYSVSSVFERIGNLRKAEENLQQALSIHREMKLMENWAEDSVYLARVAGLQGRPDVAELRMREALDLFRQLGNDARLKELTDESDDFSTVGVG
ncbi:MAG: tetratricopeptide repeat protein [Planctomycetaceae bacterium]|jgi:tetratricopeptide (TPR) repeat protein|nr:tetratricopeptide repeat protein [Planctomycetaceae bacterium]